MQNEKGLPVHHTQTGKLNLEVVTPDRIVFSGQITHLLVPGSEGDLEIMPGHTPLLTGLRTGEMVITTEGGEERLTLSEGFLEVTPGKIAVLAELAETETETDGKRPERGK